MCHATGYQEVVRRAFFSPSHTGQISRPRIAGIRTWVASQSSFGGAATVANVWRASPAPLTGSLPALRAPPGRTAIFPSEAGGSFWLPNDALVGSFWHRTAYRYEARHIAR